MGVYEEIVTELESREFEANKNSNNFYMFIVKENKKGQVDETYILNQEHFNIKDYYLIIDRFIKIPCVFKMNLLTDGFLMYAKEV